MHIEIEKERKDNYIAMRDRCGKLIRSLSKQNRLFIKDALTNWDNTGDDELVSEFVEQANISVDLANKIVECRPYFLCYHIADIMDNGYFDKDLL